MRRLQSPTASRCLPFGPFAPFVGSAGNAGFAGLTWQRCCPGYLLTPPPLTLSALWCLEWKHKTTAYQQKRIQFFMKLPLKWSALINMCFQTEIIYTKLHYTDKSAGSPTHYTYRSCLATGTRPWSSWHARGRRPQKDQKNLKYSFYYGGLWKLILMLMLAEVWTSAVTESTEHYSCLCTLPSLCLILYTCDWNTWIQRLRGVHQHLCTESIFKEKNFNRGKVGRTGLPQSDNKTSAVLKVDTQRPPGSVVFGIYGWCQRTLWSQKGFPTVHYNPGGQLGISWPAVRSIYWRYILL